ncbi:MAG: STAS domain-containing protein [Leptospirales bacterium]|nr:STAS domain-containing protein [Leptospirales bacterium]
MVVLQQDGQRIAELSGEVTVDRAASLRSELLGVWPIDELRLNGVSRIDLAGLQLLAAAKKMAKSEGRRLVFSAHSDAVLRILDLTGATAAFGDPLRIPAARRNDYGFGYGVRARKKGQ